MHGRKNIKLHLLKYIQTTCARVCAALKLLVTFTGLFEDALQTAFVKVHPDYLRQGLCCTYITCY